MKNITEPEDILSQAESVSPKQTAGPDISPDSPVARTKLNSTLTTRAANPSMSRANKLRLAAVVVIFAGGGAVWFFGWPASSWWSGWLSRPEIVTEDPVTSIPPPTVDSSAIVSPADNGPVAATAMIDTDKDGLIDSEEESLGLDITNPDTDQDGLSDKDEVQIYFTDPLTADTDGDGFVDGAEVRYGFDPNGPGRLNDIFKVIGQ